MRVKDRLVKGSGNTNDSQNLSQNIKDRREFSRSHGPDLRIRLFGYYF